MPVPPRLKDTDTGALADLFQEKQVDIDEAICRAVNEMHDLLKLPAAECDRNTLNKSSIVIRIFNSLNNIIRTNPSIVGKGLKVPASALNSARKHDANASPIGEPRQGRHTHVPRPLEPRE